MYEVNVEGLEELQRDFERLSKACTPAELEKLLQPEAQSFAQKLLPRVPVGPTGNLRSGVRAWVPRRRAGRPDAMAIAGIRAQVAPHGYIVEYGTVERYTRAGAYRGFMPPAHFFTSLRQAEEPGMLKRIIAKIHDHLERKWGY